MATYTQLTRNEDGEYIRETKTVNTPVKPLTPLSLYEPELDIVGYDEEADRTVTIAIMCDDLTESERKYYAELIVKAVNSYEFS